MNIYENIAFGLRIKKVPEAEIKNRVEKMLKLVELNGFQNRSVRSLSGDSSKELPLQEP